MCLCLVTGATRACTQCEKTCTQNRVSPRPLASSPKRYPLISRTICSIFSSKREHRTKTGTPKSVCTCMRPSRLFSSPAPAGEASGRRSRGWLAEGGRESSCSPAARPRRERFGRPQARRISVTKGISRPPSASQPLENIVWPTWRGDEPDEPSLHGYGHVRCFAMRRPISFKVKADCFFPGAPASVHSPAGAIREKELDPLTLCINVARHVFESRHTSRSKLETPGCRSRHAVSQPILSCLGPLRVLRHTRLSQHETSVTTQIRGVTKHA